MGAGTSKDKNLTQKGPAIRTPNDKSIRHLLCRFFFVPLTQIANRLQIIASKQPWLWPAFCTGLLLVLGVTSWQRTFVYRDDNLFWSDAEAKNPDCWVGYVNIGNSFFQKGQADEAIAQYQKALAINSRLAEVRTNYGNALFLKRQLGDAIEQFQMAVKVNPNYAQAHANLGMALFQTGRLDEEIAQYEKAVEINPNYELARTKLGNALLQKGQVSAAIEQYQMAIKASPTFALAHAYLGIALFQKGQFNDAITELREALRLNRNLKPVRDLLVQEQGMER